MIETGTLPDWVAWLAQDRDGTWWGYEAEPHRHHCGWYENEVGRSLRIIRTDPNPDWESTLRIRDSQDGWRRTAPQPITGPRDDGLRCA